MLKTVALNSILRGFRIKKKLLATAIKLHENKKIAVLEIK